MKEKTVNVGKRGRISGASPWVARRGLQNVVHTWMTDFTEENPQFVSGGGGLVNVFGQEPADG